MPAASRLIVEDDIRVAAAMKLALEQSGHTVSIAGNGCQALAALELLPIDLVITDCMLADMDGTELLRLLRADGRTAGLRTLLVTALPLEQLNGRATGHDLRLQTPFSDEVLRHTVETLLQLR